MTEGIRVKANQLAHEMDQIDIQCNILQDMQCADTVSLYNSQIGAVTIPQDMVTGILNDVIDNLMSNRGLLEDEFRRL